MYFQLEWILTSLACPHHRSPRTQTQINGDFPQQRLPLWLNTNNRDCPKQMSPSHSHSPQVSQDATITLTRGLNRCHPHTHQRSQQMLHSHSPEASTDVTLTLTRNHLHWRLPPTETTINGNCPWGSKDHPHQRPCTSLLAPLLVLLLKLYFPS